MRRATALALLALAVPAAAQAKTHAKPAPVPPPPAGIELSLLHTFSRPPFLFAGQRLAVRGRLPYVAGQRVTVRFYRNGRKVKVRSVKVYPVGGGAGQFLISYTSPRAGLVTVRALHPATPLQPALGARPRNVRVLNAHLSAGARGAAVRLLQHQLDHLHYAVPVSGFYDDATGRAVTAFRKMTGLNRDGGADAQVFAKLGRGAGQFHVRYARDGKHIEADLSRQVLAEIDPGGHVRRIYEMSSGKPSTPTVVGHFHVYLQELGTNAKGMVDSNFFIGGYAIHGYADVPTYAASHGCLRVPIPDARPIHDWLNVGDVVDVYANHGGSHNVRGNAGP